MAPFHHFPRVSCGPSTLWWLTLPLTSLLCPPLCLQLWRHYFHGSHALIFVIDSGDHSRMEEAKNELQALLAEDLLSNVVILVYANKVRNP